MQPSWYFSFAFFYVPFHLPFVTIYTLSIIYQLYYYCNNSCSFAHNLVRYTLPFCSFIKLLRICTLFFHPSATLSLCINASQEILKRRYRLIVFCFSPDELRPIIRNCVCMCVLVCLCVISFRVATNMNMKKRTSPAVYNLNMIKIIIYMYICM